MRKKYYTWHTLKDAIQSVDIRLSFSERDIWSCYLGSNIGDEEDGSGDDLMRPAAIVRKFSDHLCLIVPLTRTPKNSGYYFTFSFIGSEQSRLILTQLRVIDSKRLVKRIGYIREKEFFRLKEQLKALLL